MNSSQTLLFDEPQKDQTLQTARLIHAGAAALLLVLIFPGFLQFYFHGRAYPNREPAPPTRTLLILHGIGMSVRGLPFLLQPLLIVAGNRLMGSVCKFPASVRSSSYSLTLSDCITPAFS